MRGRKAGVENSSKCLYYTAEKDGARNNTSLRLEKEIRTRTEKKMGIECEM